VFFLFFFGNIWPVEGGIFVDIAPELTELKTSCHIA